MANYAKTKTLSPTDAAYIAGIIDGEGSISLSRRHRNEQRQLEVSISNTDFALLEYIHQAVGAGRISNKRTYKDVHTPSATYCVSNRQALDLLEQLQPFLRTYKKERSDLVLNNYVRLTPRNGKYNQELLDERKKFVDKFLNTKPKN